jgi:5,10-methylenetetrahydromethanopterin reductase
MGRYIGAFRRLLRGETVEWDGGRMRMLHPARAAAPRPVEVPVLISALGPKGFAVARELADGLFSSPSVVVRSSRTPSSSSNKPYRMSPWVKQCIW